MKQILLSMSLLFLANPILQAQGAAVARKAAQAATRANSAVTKGTLSHYGGIYGAGMGVDYQLARHARTTTPPSVSLSTPNIQRSLITQKIRDFKAWKLKRARQKQATAQLKQILAEQELVLAKAALPPLMSEKAFTVTDFTDLTPQHNQLPKPVVPFVAEPGTIAYRGLALAADGESIKNILTNGLRLQDAGEENSTLRIAYASHGGYYAVRNLLENPVTNLTYGPNSAAGWGARRLGPDLPILTVVKVRGEFVGDSLETATEDIPVSQIEELIVRLNLEGTLTWCKVELNADHTFTLTPYMHYPQK